MTRRPTASRLTAILLGGAVAACVNPPSQTYRSTFQNAESDGLESRSWTNMAEIGLQDTVGPDLEYRFSERLIHTDQSFSGSGVDIQSRSFLHQPSLDLLATFGFLRWTQGYEFQSTQRDFEDAGDEQRLRTNLLQKLEWTPEDLPQVSAWFDYRTDEDDRFFDRQGLESVLQIEQAKGPFDYQYSYEARNITDDLADIERDIDLHLFRGNYQDTYFDGKLTGSLGIFLDESQRTDRSGSGTAATVPVLPSAGLSAIDATPQIVTLPNNPLLIDGDTATSAGINIGGFSSGGEINWNIGVELPPGALVDEVFLDTMDAVDSLLVSQFSFSVWVSDDNSFWSLVSSSASFTYESALQRFRISFPRITSRYLKVVNTSSPGAGPGVFVTEMEPLTVTATTGTGSSVSSSNSTRNMTGNLTWLVGSNVSLTYNLFLQDIESETGGLETRDEQRVDNGLTALWTPHNKVDVTVRGETQNTNNQVQFDTAFLFLNGLVTYRPLDTLDATLNYSLTQQEQDGQDRLDTNAAQIGTSAQLLETLQANLAFQLVSQEDFLNQRDIDRQIVSASLNAELTQALDMTISLLQDDATVSGPGAAGIPDPSEDRYLLTAIYQPSARFAADAEIGWVDTFAGAGWDQRYRIDWLPFQDGSLDLQLNAGRINVTSAGNQKQERYQALSRWTFNPFAFLELNYSTRILDSERTNLFTISFNASF